MTEELGIQGFGQSQVGDGKVHGRIPVALGLPRNGAQVVERSDVSDVVILSLVGFLLAHHEQRNEVVLLPGFRAIAVFHPLELRRILGAVVLAEIPHLLQSEEPVVILTVAAIVVFRLLSDKDKTR